MTCPFLFRDESCYRCRTMVYQIIETSTGRTRIFQSITPSEAKKCMDESLYPKCPTYRTANKKTCPACGQVYLPEEAVQITVNNKIMPACPNCGAVEVKR